MFDVERDGWKAETQVLLSKIKASVSSGSSQIWVGGANEQPQQQQPKQKQAGPAHKKESGFEQLDTVGPEDYNKLLKQWMVRRRARGDVCRVLWRANFGLVYALASQDLQAEHRKSIAEKTAMTYKVRSCSIQGHWSRNRTTDDCRLPRCQMRNHESQLKALTQELHFLRPIAMNGRRPAQSPAQVKSSPPPRSHGLPPIVSPPQPQSRRQTLGDARSEHLLLAARRLRTLREKNPEIGLITAAHYTYASLQVPDPNAALEPYTEGASELDDEDGAKDRTPRGKIRPKGKKAASGSMAPPKTPITTSIKGKGRRKDDGAVQRTPGGSLGTPGRGFEELLAAAQSLQHPTHPTSTLRDAYAEPPANSSTPTGPPESPKRRRVGSAGAGWVPGASTIGPSGGEGGLHTSALDLLALASSHDPASPAPSSSARLGGLLGSGGSDNDVGSDSGRSAGSASRGLEPAFALRTDVGDGFGHSFIGSDPPVAGPSTTPSNARLPPDGSSPYLASRTPSALPQRVKEEFAGFASEADSQSPPAIGVAPFDSATNAVPARRVRSPYLKWSPDEDELLARGVAKYGQKWCVEKNCLGVDDSADTSSSLAGTLSQRPSRPGAITSAASVGFASSVRLAVMLALGPGLTLPSPPGRCVRHVRPQVGGRHAGGGRVRKASVISSAARVALATQGWWRRCRVRRAVDLRVGLGRQQLNTSTPSTVRFVPSCRTLLTIVRRRHSHASPFPLFFSPQRRLHNPRTCSPSRLLPSYLSFDRVT